MDMTLLAASGRLQNVIKYCTKVRKTGVAGNESNNYNHQIHTDIYIGVCYSRTGYDVTSYSSRQLSEFKIQPKMLNRVALDQILVARRFALPSQVMGFLLELNIQ